MDIARDCVIHSKGGQLGENVTSVADAQRIARQAFTTGKQNGVVLHFHGGLVSKSSGEAIALRLGERYSGASTYPVFSVWESGILETLRNNLKDILQDQVFRELVKKVGEWVLREGTSAIATRGAGQAVNTAQLRADFDAYFTGKSSEPPLKEQSPPKGQVSKGALPAEDELAAKIEAEIELDPTFQETMAGLFVAANRVSPAVTRGASIEPRPVKLIIDKKAIDEMFPPLPTGATRGGIPWFTVAKFVAKVVVASISRFVGKRDHGAYATVVEEVLRAAYLAKVGEVVWRQMKKDTADAFGDAKGAGEVVLQAWAKLLQEGKPAPRITLVGHSTGALYIDQWISRSAEIAPKLSYDVIMLAPACRCEDFANLLARHGALIANFRVFAMQDAVEQQDRLVSIIYPRSLLYFVSGVVEGDVDVPLLGMQRYVADTEVFDAADFPAVQQVREFFAASKQRTVWSVSDGGPGLSSASVSHGDFDDDEQTLVSLSSILTAGF